MNIQNTDRMTVHLEGKAIYDIVTADSFDRLKEEIGALDIGTRKICIVTDSNVASLYLHEVSGILSDCCRYVTSFVFPAGEAHKNLDTVASLYEHLIQEHFDRKDVLVALGGGVTGDLCGFAAATYLRGVRFIQIPTTLLSQVDSSIGGKTGVDFASYKNMVGAFHMPMLVYTNVSVLKTLDEEQFSAGMGEVIKHGLIRDKEYYTWLLENQAAIHERDQTACLTMIVGSNRIKREVVEIDPREQNERATLNFGHTLGHAIEKLMDFKLLHGRCVALGAAAALEICRRRGLVSAEEVADYRKAAKAFGISLHVAGLDSKAVIAATKNDKKMEAGVIRFILLNGIGHAYIDTTVTEAEMEHALSVVM